MKRLLDNIARFMAVAACSVAMLLFSALDVLADTPPPGVKDVSGYKIRDSGYIAPNPSKRVGQYWVDNDRILFIGAALTSPRRTTPVPGQRASELRLHLWDLKTNEVTVHHDADLTYGNLCVRDQYVVLRYDIRNNEKNEWRRFVFEGPFGQEKLAEVEIPRPSTRKDAGEGRRDVEYNAFTCRSYRRSDLPRLGSSVTPLLPGEYLAREYAQDDEQARNKLPLRSLFWPNDGKPVPVLLANERASVQRYFSYRDSYVLEEAPLHVIISEKVLRRYGLMDRKGNIQDFTPPTGPWMNSTVHVAPTQRGMFVAARGARGGSNRAAGGYLMAGGRLQRLIAGHPESFDISPDGCKVALSIADATVDLFTSTLKMLDVCSKGH